MSENIYDDKFMNWAIGVITLQKTKDGIFDFIKFKMEILVLALLQIVKLNDTHFENFLKKVTFDGRMKNDRRLGWIIDPKYKCKSAFLCGKCDAMVDLLTDNIDDGHKNVRWKCHDRSIMPDNYWWILSKIYIPTDLKASCGPNDVDAQAVFQLMTCCKLFSDVKNIVSSLLTWRNKLMHSRDNTLSFEHLQIIFEYAEELLTHKAVNSNSDSVRNALREIKKLKSRRFIGVSIDRERHTMIKEALTVKKQCIEFDMNANQKEGKEVEKLKELLRLTRNHIAKEEIHIKENTRSEIEILKKRTEEAERNRAREKRRADSAERRADREKSRADSLEKKLGEKNTTFLGSVATGAAVGGTTGTVGGPVGAVVGGTVGAVFGGISSLFR